MAQHRHPLALALIASATVIGIAGTDLVLPAVPDLPRLLGGTPAAAQLVLAAFTAGAALGLLLFGELGARFDQRRLLILSFLAYALLSLACTFSPSLDALIALRFAQGAASAAAPVFAPGMLRALYGDRRAVGALGVLGSIEALTPALAPVAGVWLLQLFGWHAAFDAIALIAFLLALVFALLGARLPVSTVMRPSGHYGHVLTRRPFLRQALSHAFTLGALLVIVFGAPTVFVASMGGTLDDFILLQMLGVATFIVAASAAGRLVGRFGAEPLILGGTLTAMAGAWAMLGYALLGGTDTLMVTGCFLFVNGGLGLRGPPGFHAAIVAAQDDARGAALLIVAILLATSAGTALVAPFIGAGLVAIAAGGAALTTVACLILLIPGAR
jgi:predicted MFS family arabinose efflux permease